MNGTKNTDIPTTKDVNWAISQYEHKTVIETTERRPKTPYSGSTKEARINDRSKRSAEADRSVASDSDAEGTIDHIIDQMNKVFENDASREKSVLDMNQALNEMINTLERMDVISNERKVRKLIQPHFNSSHA